MSIEEIRADFAYQQGVSDERAQIIAELKEERKKYCKLYVAGVDKEIFLGGAYGIEKAIEVIRRREGVSK